MAVRNPERLDGLITHRIWTREHEGRRRSWNHPDWCRCLRRSGRLAVRASTPDSTNRLLLAIPFFTHLPTCWIGYQRRDGLPVHPTILCPCATSSSTPDSVGFSHDGNDRRHTSPHDRDIFPCPHDDHGRAHRIQLPPATASTVVWLVAAGGLYPYGFNRIHPADSLWGFVLWHP